MPQKRHRIYFLGYHKSTKIYKELKKSEKSSWLLKLGVLAKAFKVKKVEPETTFELNGSLDELSKSFNKNGKLSPFLNTGLMINGQVMTLKSSAVYKGKQTLLRDIVQTKDIDNYFYLTSNVL